MPAPELFRDRLDRRLKIGASLVVTVTVLSLTGLRAFDLWRDHDDTLDRAEERAVNVARVLAAYLRQTLAATDASLRQLAIHGQRIGGARASTAEWRPILGASEAALPGVGSLTVTDAAGVIRHSTIETIIGQSRADEYLFKALRAEPRDVMIASTPFRSTVTPTILIPLGRRLTDDQGRFDGIVVATLVPQELRGAFEEITVGLADVIWVLHPTGLVLLREPSRDDAIGESAIGLPLFETARSARSAGTVRGPVQPGGALYLSAYDVVEDPALIVAVSVARDATLAEWWREVRISSWALAIFAVLGLAGLMIVFREFDARVRAEDALRRAQRLEAIGQLTGGVAHDFNNLLTIILGYASLLRSDAPQPLSEDTEVALTEIERAGRRAMDLIRALLAFASRQPLHPRVIDLSAQVGTLPALLRPLLGEDISVIYKAATTPLFANVDVAQLEAALMNLCVNARDAMPKGGLIVIETRATTLDAEDARLRNDVTAGPYCLVSVSDTGEGVAPEHLPRIHEPFFTTKEPGKGTGLGLSMVYGFVKQSGGHIQIYSEVGKGTVVKLFFPQASEQETVPTAVAATADFRGRGERILLVEDEDGVRRFATQVLTALGYRVVAASDGPAALTLADTEPDLQLLLTDVVMPHGMTGPQLAEQLLLDRPQLKVLFASGYSAEVLESRSELRADGGLLSKPYDRDELARAVRRALDAPFTA